MAFRTFPPLFLRTETGYQVTLLWTSNKETPEVLGQGHNLSRCRSGENPARSRLNRIFSWETSAEVSRLQPINLDNEIRIKVLSWPESTWMILTPLPPEAEPSWVVFLWLKR